MRTCGDQTSPDIHFLAKWEFWPWTLLQWERRVGTDVSERQNYIFLANFIEVTLVNTITYVSGTQSYDASSVSLYCVFTTTPNQVFFLYPLLAAPPLLPLIIIRETVLLSIKNDVTFVINKNYNSKWHMQGGIGGTGGSGSRVDEKKLFSWALPPQSWESVAKRKE